MVLTHSLLLAHTDSRVCNTEERTISNSAMAIIQHKIMLHSALKFCFRTPYAYALQPLCAIRVHLFSYNPQLRYYELLVEHMHIFSLFSFFMSSSF